MEPWLNDTDVKTKALGEKPVSVPLFQPHWTDPGFCSEMLATNHLSRGMALCESIVCIMFKTIKMKI
jgi:hypothetical protein